MALKTLDTAELNAVQIQAVLQGAIVPRPIAFVSSCNAAGEVNLSPFSFFNLFSSNPPILIFSPARRVRDNTTKHTLENVMEWPECTVNVVSYAMVQQCSLASTEYTRGVNEFTKSGLTMLPSLSVKPPRVAESPVQLECKVLEVKPLGDQGGAGNLVICEVKRIHLAEKVLDENGRIDPHKIDLVARLGGDWYSRARDGLFAVEKPLTTRGIGVDALPEAVQQSRVLRGNELGRLGNLEVLPDAAAQQAAWSLAAMEDARQRYGQDTEGWLFHGHEIARQWIAEDRVAEALALLLAITAIAR